MGSSTAEFGVEVDDMISVLIIAIFVAASSELVTYLLFFRSKEFRDQHQEILSLTRKQHMLELQHPVPVSSSIKADKAIQAVEQEINTKTRMLASTRQKANLLSAVIFTIFMPSMYSAYDGVVVAKLPLEPIAPFKYLTHATLPGEDYTDCSFTFLVTSTMLIIKTGIQKYLGYGVPAGSKQPNTMFPKMV